MHMFQVLPKEIKFFTSDDLARHMEGGNESETGHRGHPQCSRCRECFFDRVDFNQHQLHVCEEWNSDDAEDNVEDSSPEDSAGNPEEEVNTDRYQDGEQDPVEDNVEDSSPEDSAGNPEEEVNTDRYQDGEQDPEIDGYTACLRDDIIPRGYHLDQNVETITDISFEQLQYFREQLPLVKSTVDTFIELVLTYQETMYPLKEYIDLEYLQYGLKMFLLAKNLMRTESVLIHLCATHDNSNAELVKDIIYWSTYLFNTAMNVFDRTLKVAAFNSRVPDLHTITRDILFNVCKFAYVSLGLMEGIFKR